MTGTPPATEHALAPCAHEVMRRLVPEFDRAVADTARQSRSSSDWVETRTIRRDRTGVPAQAVG